MGIVSTITSFIKDEVLGISSTEQVQSASKKQATQKKNSVIENKNVEHPLDELVITQKASPKKNTEDLGARKARIENKCKAYNINYAEIVQLCPLLLNMPAKSFDNLSNEKKAEVYNVVEKIIDNIIEKTKKHGISKNVKQENIIKEQAMIAYQAISTGSVKSIEELMKEAGDINAELGGEGFSKLSLSNQRKKMEQAAISRRRDFEARLQERLASVPEGKRAEVEAKMRTNFANAQKISFNEIILTKEPDVALNSMVILNGNDMGYGAECLMQSYSNGIEAERIASQCFSYGFQEDLIKTYAERGETPNADAVKQFTFAFSSNMTSEALTRYQDDYLNARNKYERGEGPSYMKKEYYTATAKGIGIGAMYNKSMSLEEKAEFLAKWERDAKSFDDYEIVTQAIKDAMSKDSAFAAKFKEAQKRLSEKQSNKKAEENNVKVTNKKSTDVVESETSNPNVTTQVSQVNYIPVSAKTDIETQRVTAAKEIDNEQKKDNLQTNPIVIGKVSAQKLNIIKELKENPLTSVIQDYSRKDVVEAILSDSDLSKHYSVIEKDIKQYDLAQLIQVTKNCSTKGLLFVLETISPELAPKFFEEKEKDGLCHSARVLGEKRLEESNEKYATT